MDQERFDHIARTLAPGPSRRGMLKGLTGTAVGGLLAAVGLADASAKGPCTAPSFVCGSGKNAACCASTEVCTGNGVCVTPDPCAGKDCSTGNECVTGYCEGGECRGSVHAYESCAGGSGTCDTWGFCET